MTDIDHKAAIEGLRWTKEVDLTGVSPSVSEANIDRAISTIEALAAENEQHKTLLSRLLQWCDGNYGQYTKQPQQWSEEIRAALNHAKPENRDS